MAIGVCLDTLCRDLAAFLSVIVFPVFELVELPLAVTRVRQLTFQSILVFYLCLVFYLNV